MGVEIEYGGHASMRSCGGYARRIASCFVALILLGGGVAAFAAKPQATIDAEIAKQIQEAEVLIAHVEFEKAKALLDRASKRVDLDGASLKRRAELFVALGRARAELGDLDGMREAFVIAVALHHPVRLARGTSPKILDALEETRRAFGRMQHPETPRSKSKSDRPLPVLRSVETPKTTDAVAKPTAPEPARDVVETRPSLLLACWLWMADERTGVSSPDHQPRLVPCFEGNAEAHATIRVGVIMHNIVPQAVVQLWVRPSGAEHFAEVPLARGATVAAASLVLDRPRFELFFEAWVADALAAHAGSREAPLLLDVAPPEGVGVALSDRRPPAARAPSYLNVPVQRVDWVLTASTTQTSTAVALAPVERESGSGWVVWGGAALVAVMAATALILVLTSRGSDCHAEGGLGCTEVHVRSLMRF